MRVKNTQSEHSCLLRAWRLHHSELRGWLNKQLLEASEVEDLLQNIFIKSLMQKEVFCSLTNARAWLFRVTRNQLIDHYRLDKKEVPLPSDIPNEEPDITTIDDLSHCIPRVLSELSQEDREAITHCDLNGESQQQYADLKNISLSAAKSRVQRARKRLKIQLETACQVQKDTEGRVYDFVPRAPLT